MLFILLKLTENKVLYLVTMQIYTNSLFLLIKVPIMSRIKNNETWYNDYTSWNWLQKNDYTQQTLTSVLYKDNNNSNWGTKR